MRLNQASPAAAEFARTLRIQSDYPLAHFYLGASLERLGDKRGALLHYRHELELNPGFKPAQEALRRLR